MRRLRACLSVLPMVLSGTAFAAPVADLTLNLAGSIPEICNIRQTSRDTVVDLRDGPGAYDIYYHVYCNAPLAVSLTSKNGGLEHDQYRHWPDSPGFTGLIRYDAQFKLATPGAVAVSTRSDLMKNGVTGETGVVPFTSDARLHLSWTPEGTLLGGRYEDLITVHVFGAGT